MMMIKKSFFTNQDLKIKKNDFSKNGKISANWRGEAWRSHNNPFANKGKYKRFSSLVLRVIFVKNHAGCEATHGVSRAAASGMRN
jgi:hypothetical protein